MAFGHIFCTMSALLATCKNQISRAKKKIWSKRSTSSPSSPSSTKLRLIKPSKAAAAGSLPFGCVKKFSSTGKVTTSPTDRTKLRRNAKNGGDDRHGRKKVEEEEEGEVGEEVEPSVWRRTILMGEKCRPLNFPGVIYYDSEGKQLMEVPTPRTPMTPRTPTTPGESPFSAALQLNSGESAER